MITFGWSDYDPLEGSATSIDPLRSLANSVVLGNLVFPGTSGRVWRIRYLSALCFLMKCANLKRGETFQENYKKFRKFENAFILALNELKKRKNSEHDFQRIIGLEKAEQLVRSNTRSISIIGDILSNQVNLGPLGVHTVLLRELDLVESERELILLPSGELLANYYEKSIGINSELFIEKISNNRIQTLRPEDFETITESLLFEFKTKTKNLELETIQKKIFSNDIRKQLFTDILSIGKKAFTANESQLIDYLVHLKSPLIRRYKLIRAYDVFQRILKYHFDVIRNVPKEKIQFQLKGDKRISESYSEIKNILTTAIRDLVDSIDGYLIENEDSDDVLIEIKKFAEEVSTFNEYIEFTDFLVEFHEKHQKEKGKAPWVRKYAEGRFEIAPSYIMNEELTTFKESMKSNIHSYRLSNCLKMIVDMDLQTVL